MWNSEPAEALSSRQGTSRARYFPSNSPQEWLDQVRTACASSQTKPELIFIDIGPTGEWGYPIDASMKSRWPDYHSAIWKMPHSARADLYFVDGRFRVACFAQIVLHCNPNAIIGIHDFGSRPKYHCVREIAREVATAGDISFFRPLPKKKLQRPYSGHFTRSRLSQRFACIRVTLPAGYNSVESQRSGENDPLELRQKFLDRRILDIVAVSKRKEFHRANSLRIAFPKGLPRSRFFKSCCRDFV